MSRRVIIRWDDRQVTGRWQRPRGATGPAVLLAHGAGTDQDHPSIVRIREGLAAHGLPVLTFNYPYKEAGRGGPDRQEVLLACHRAAAAWVRQRFDDVIFAGRSMGGRMASYLAAEGEPCSGLVLYAYPLHPAGRPEKLRKDHLGEIESPMLFFIGDRDALALPDLVDRWIRPLEPATIEVIADADHSFRVPKRTGRTSEEVVDWIIERTVRWIDGLSIGDQT